ncbi:hypothetical protein E5676_scaffold488G00870 [Cucumis melo var. makuwa]|uniref:Uncharacterized protein n=1 Tax=Cucumis melo var. makuwa TaxID=1194695 RepID=A0A5D3CPN2_CUCMM|nr:hypothetical protein E5676_scaffold488G00870 [Cucumis melo var. makuwa]
MDISPETLDWIRKCFKALLETSNTKHLFNERRQEDYCMWVRKTKNKSKSGSTAEIFRIDNKGRKCSVLVPEGIDKFGWKSFVAMLTFKHHSHHKRLRSESTNGWTTVGNYQVKFERWDTKKHACQTLIPSYGGWMRFKGVPLHLWNYDSFVNIGKACGGFLAVAKETMEKENLIEAKIKVKYNYTGFVPASILLIDDQGENFVVYTVPPPKGRWFIERNVNFHGTFKIEAADDFDNLNPNAEKFTFAGNHAIPPKNSKNQSDS